MSKAASLHVDEEQDAPIIQAFDAWVDIQRRAIEAVDSAKALVSGTTNGNRQKLPELNVLADATKMVIALAQQLGRTPAARIRLGADGGGDESEDDLDLPALPERGKQPKPPQVRKPRAKAKPKTKAKPNTVAKKSPAKRGKSAAPPK